MPIWYYFGMTSNVAMNIRISPELKRRVEAYAQVTGISTNASVAVLLDQALRAEGVARD